MLKLKLSAILLAASMALLAGRAPAQADELTWYVQSYHPNTVELEFYSSDRNAAWPGDGQVYVLDDSEVHAYTLGCQTGELICYGAWVSGDASTYWGTGPGGSGGCDDCCYSCEGGETPVRVLE